MKTHYEVLGIEKTAPLQEIKRAYFTLVRQYPPERFPEEFKQVRAAYETLSSEQKRAEYDKTGALPEDIAPLFWEAQNANIRGRHSQAADTYSVILKRYPELAKIREEYAFSMEAEGKSGKAMEAWEYLCKQEPDNADYALNLAESYDQRGWNKKAATQYRRTLEIDSGCASAWTALMDQHIKAKDWRETQKICREAVEAVKEKDSGNLYLYTKAFIFCTDNDAAFGGECLNTIFRFISDGKQKDPDDIEMTVALLLSSLIAGGSRFIHFYPQIKRIAELLPRMDGQLRKSLVEAGRSFDFYNLEKNGFPVLLRELLGRMHDGVNSKEDGFERMSMEFLLLDDWDTYHSPILRLKKEYPELYSLHEDFFDEALSTPNHKKMVQQRLKTLAKHHVRPIGYMDGEEDEEPVETVRREQPKIGRNDPCPCGSGKKYKKCCGA
ncbi:MAG: DnaJ domain-containing protein [Spirochaetales bacterium]|jgi:curved DNA-binding protein CbpA|nr:DnaJ domain-containing protein [Spirochaetales bacterium]